MIQSVYDRPKINNSTKNPGIFKKKILCCHFWVSVEFGAPGGGPSLVGRAHHYVAAGLLVRQAGIFHKYIFTVYFEDEADQLEQVGVIHSSNF